MERKKSESFHRVKPENWNCAQALLKGFQHECHVSEAEIESYRTYGGGRAPGGLCGALYMAGHLLGEEHKPALEEAFVRELGYATCRDLKRNKVDCAACLRLADRLVEEGLEKK